MSEITAPKLENADAPNPDPETTPPIPEIQAPDEEKSPPEEGAKAADPEEACVVVKEDATPRGRRMADEAREVAAAHASMLVDIEACKRVSMSRRLPFIQFYFVLSRLCVYLLFKPTGSLSTFCINHCVMSIWCSCVVPGSVSF